MLEHVTRHAQFLQAQHGGLFVEDAHNAGLAVDGRDRRDAEVDLAAGAANTHTPVLGKSALRDVQIGQDFDSADDGGMKALWRRTDLMQHAVDPVPDPEFAVEGLDMNVRSSVLNRLID